MMTGSLALFSAKIKIPNSTILPSSKAETSGLIPSSPNNWNPNSNETSMAIKLKLPKISIGLDSCMIFGSFKYSQIKIINRIPIGTLIKKIQCQLIVSTMNPPASGPKTLAIPQAELFKPKTFARFSIE